MVEITKCASIRFLRLMGTQTFFNPSLLLSWMFEHDCLDTCCFGCLICMCFIFCTCTCSAQLSMFDAERRSRNTVTILLLLTGMAGPC